MDDSEKQYINVICITMYNRTFGKEVVEFMGLKVNQDQAMIYIWTNSLRLDYLPLDS